MSTPAQLSANIANAQLSTGPRTPDGKSASSKNSVTHGLFSGDFIRPGEEQIYADRRTALFHELQPEGFIEQTAANEILRATWRLHRCGEVESRLINWFEVEKTVLDPMEAISELTEKIQHSVDRARAQALRIFHRCMAEIRRLQAERRSRAASPAAETLTEVPRAQRTQSQPAGTPRNAHCPCGSGQKFKRCCGKEAPPMLHAA